MTARVMIVEGDSGLGLELQGQAENLGFAVVANLTSGEAALASAEESLPDLVLVDVVLAGEMSGLDTAAAMRSSWNVPVVYLTAPENQEALLHTEVPPAHGCLVTPVQPAALALTLNAALHAAQVDRQRDAGSRREGLAAAVVEALNRHQEDAVIRVLNLVKEETGFESVGIRLWDGDELLCHEVSGPAPASTTLRQTLCTGRGAAGGGDGTGQPHGGCLCAEVIAGAPGAAVESFTEGGSFWTDSGSALLATLAAPAQPAAGSNRCLGEGFETVVLVPLRAGSEVLGLLHLRDPRPGFATAGDVAFLERLGVCLGTALSRLRSFEQLEGRERTMRQLAGAGWEGIGVHDEGILLLANHQFYEMFGYLPEELLGHEALAMTTTPESRRVIQERIAEGRMGPYEAEGLRKDGSTFPIEIRVRRAEYDGKQVRVAAIRDISERRRMEDALRTSEEKFSKAFQRAPLLMTISSLDDGTMLEVNEAWCRVSGYTRDEALNRTSLELEWLSPDQRREVIQKLVAEGSFRGEELTCRGSDGRPIQLLLNAEIITLGGREYVVVAAVDITDRKRAEEEVKVHREHLEELVQQRTSELARSRQQLELAVEGAELGMWDLDLETGECTFNRLWSEILGYSADEIEPRFDSWKELLHPDDRQRVVETAQQNLDGDVPYYRSEHRLRTRSGEWKWIQARGRVVERDPGGRPLRHSGVYLDIDDRVRAEQEVRASRDRLETLVAERTEELTSANESLRAEIAARIKTEERMREHERVLSDILEGVLSGYWDWNIPENTEYLSPAFKKMFGYEDHELANAPESWQQLVFPEDLESVFQVFDRHVKSHGTEPYYNEVRYRHKDGSTVWVICAGRVIEWAEDGSPVRMIGCHVDISDLKRVEEALRESEERFRTLFENAPLGYQSLDERGNIVVVNDTWCKALGYTKEEVLGRSFADFLHPEFHEHFRENFPRFKSLGYIIGVQFEMIRKDGTEIIVSFDGKIGHHEDGSFKQTHCVLQDITDRLRAEEEHSRLEAAARRAQHMESLGVLAGGVAHDFNNMLCAITGFADLALEAVQQDSEVREYLEHLMVAASRASEMVEQILTFSRQAESTRVVVRMNEVIEETVKLLRTMLPSSIVLRTEVAGDIPPILGDPTQLQQVLMNLCTNAYHAMPDGGHLTLQVDEQVVDAEEIERHAGVPAPSHLHIAVRDTGAGIAPDILERIFEPFFTTKEVGKGSGMGLATTHGIINSHGGFITVDSELGSGSVFHLFLPSSDDETVTQVPLEARDVPRGSERILIIDDERSMLEMTSAMLRNLGYRVSAFSSGAEALEALGQSPQGWDLVLTDQTMPGMDGVEILKRVRSLRGDLPVAIMTGHSDKLEPSADGGVGASAVLKKPFRRAALAEALRSALDTIRT